MSYAKHKIVTEHSGMFPPYEFNSSVPIKLSDLHGHLSQLDADILVCSGQSSISLEG
jgi:hypothetical protein